MNNVVKAVRTLRTLSPEEFKLALALSRSPAAKVGRPRKLSSKPKAKRAKRIEPQPEAV